MKLGISFPMKKDSKSDFFAKRGGNSKLEDNFLFYLFFFIIFFKLFNNKLSLIELSLNENISFKER